MAKNSSPEQADRYLRVRQILEIFPVCKATFYQMVADGRMPKPALRASKRAVFWRESDLREAIARMEEQTQAAAEAAA